MKYAHEYLFQQGVSSVKTRDTPFRKNDAFSQEIDEYFDDTQPYDQENYPKMWYNFIDIILFVQKLFCLLYTIWLDISTLM